MRASGGGINGGWALSQTRKGSPRLGSWTGRSCRRGTGQGQGGCEFGSGHGKFGASHQAALRHGGHPGSVRGVSLPSEPPPECQPQLPGSPRTSPPWLHVVWRLKSSSLTAPTEGKHMLGVAAITAPHSREQTAGDVRHASLVQRAGCRCQQCLHRPGGPGPTLTKP